MISSLFKSVLLVALSTPFIQQSVEAHSWVHCTDYYGGPLKYDAGKCRSYPRKYMSTYGHETFAAQGGFNYNGGGSCRDRGRSSNSQEIAKYQQGGIYCLAWSTQNHVADSSNVYIPDTQMKIYAGPKGVADPDQGSFKRHELITNFGVHKNGKTDCLGFQRAPDFGHNRPGSLASGCFYVDLPPGDYTFQWYWEFNPGSPYKTCWDVTVTGKFNGSPKIPMNPAVPDTDTLGGSCKSNWNTENRNFYNRIEGNGGRRDDETENIPFNYNEDYLNYDDDDDDDSDNYQNIKLKKQIAELKQKIAKYQSDSSNQSDKEFSRPLLSDGWNENRRPHRVALIEQPSFEKQEEKLDEILQELSLVESDLREMNWEK